MKKQAKKRFYILGVGGVAMGNLAGLLKQKGYEVAGSDQETMYEPMKGLLQQLKIPVFVPYREFHVKRWKPDIVVVGNAIKRGNPELEYAMSNGHIYRSVSDILREEFIESKKAIVITGTHGKTTTAALIAWILECAELDPTVFVGGFIRQQVALAPNRGVQAQNIPLSCKLGKGEYVVLEGDEYDTVFFDKNPKFYAYRPYIGIVNNIELDHIDMYRDLEHLKNSFHRFSMLIPQNGLLVLNRENKNSYELAPWEHAGQTIWKTAKPPNIWTFGLKRGDFTANGIKLSQDGIMFHLKHKGRYIGDISASLSGKHNITNILAAISVARFLKIPITKIVKAISSFDGVKRRAEVLGKVRGVTVIDDYAHHPTAVRETLLGLRKMFPMKRLVVLFEPGSASSRRRIFEGQYFKSFLEADAVFLYKPYKSVQLKKSEVFHGLELAKKLSSVGISSRNLSSVDSMLYHVKHYIKPGDIVVIMSCRAFDGLREKIFDFLK